MPFPFEKMIVYQKAEQWAERVEQFVCRKYACATYGMLDQLSRAANSVPLNIAEGLGKWSDADRKRFLQMARGSVYECVPILNFLKRKNIISDEEHLNSYRHLDELGRMLTALIKEDHRTRIALASRSRTSPMS